MLSSIKGRIFVGFGVVLALLVAATIVDEALILRIKDDFGQFQSAMSQKSQYVDVDLVMQKVRVRVNQWLRSPGPTFTKQADELLVQDTALLAEAEKSVRTEKEKQTIAEMTAALKAYIESWRVIQGWSLES